MPSREARRGVDTRGAAGRIENTRCGMGMPHRQCLVWGVVQYSRASSARRGKPGRAAFWAQTTRRWRRPGHGRTPTRAGLPDATLQTRPGCVRKRSRDLSGPPPPHSVDRRPVLAPRIAAVRHAGKHPCGGNKVMQTVTNKGPVRKEATAYRRETRACSRAPSPPRARLAWGVPARALEM